MPDVACAVQPQRNASRQADTLTRNDAVPVDAANGAGSGTGKLVASTRQVHLQ